jgi:hypothetical protein
MPAFVITYERPSVWAPDLRLTDSTLWITPEGWDIPTTRERFEATQNNVRVIDITPHRHD